MGHPQLGYPCYPHPANNRRILGNGLIDKRVFEIHPNNKPMKQFDIGIYTFHRQVAGFICPEDDQKTENGQVFAVLHPMQKVDFKGLYCFGVDKASGDTKTLVRKNLRFNKVVTLQFSQDGITTSFEEVHAKLNAALNYLKGGEQLSVIPEVGLLFRARRR